MKNHFKLKKEEVGMNPVIGSAIRPRCIRTAITSVPQAKSNRG